MVSGNDFKKAKLIINNCREKLKNDPVIIDLFDEYGVDIEELKYYPICFKDDLEVSARTEHACIYLNSKLFGDVDKICEYLSHEVTHILQQTTGDGPTEGSTDDNYLQNDHEIEGFQNQTKYISNHEGPEKAEEYIEQVMEHHDVPENEKEEIKDDLLRTASFDINDVKDNSKQLSLFEKRKENLPEDDGGFEEFKKFLRSDNKEEFRPRKSQPLQKINPEERNLIVKERKRFLKSFKEKIDSQDKNNVNDFHFFSEICLHCKENKAEIYPGLCKKCYNFLYRRDDKCAFCDHHVEEHYENFGPCTVMSESGYREKPKICPCEEFVSNRFFFQPIKDQNDARDYNKENTYDDKSLNEIANDYLRKNPEQLRFKYHKLLDFDFKIKKVKQLSPTEIAELKELTLGGESAMTDYLQQKSFKNEDFTVLCIDKKEDRIVGWLLARLMNGEEIYIDVFVDRWHRESGIGSELMKKFDQYKKLQFPERKKFTDPWSPTAGSFYIGKNELNPEEYKEFEKQKIYELKNDNEKQLEIKFSSLKEFIRKYSIHLNEMCYCKHPKSSHYSFGNELCDEDSCDCSGFNTEKSKRCIKCHKKLKNISTINYCGNCIREIFQAQRKNEPMEICFCGHGKFEHDFKSPLDIAPCNGIVESGYRSSPKCKCLDYTPKNKLASYKRNQ